ncbi:MAG: tail fiber domain-containing protein [Oscillospiraceae bacterium]|nr:tail fiber domain-containing protein [Oscillospiraceae bacterium]
MIAVSNLAANAISANSRTFLSRFLCNGAEIGGDVRSVIINKGSCGDSAFTPGAVFSSYIDVVIDNCSEALAGKELTYQIGVVLDENTTEWYDIGKFTVHKPSTNVYTTSFTALGRISAKMGMLYQSKLTFPTTIQKVLDEISANTGIEIDATAFDTSGVIEKEISGYMYREVLAIIAGLFFGFATEDAAGRVVFASYKNANVISTDGDRTSVLPNFADTDTKINGVKVSAGDISTTDSETGNEVYKEQIFLTGSPNAVTENEFMTQALFDANAGNVVGYTYRPATVSISLGDFRIEPFDSLQVTDSLGVVRTVPCMSVVHRFDGGIITDITAPELADSDDSGTAFKGLLSQAVERYQQELISVKTLLAGKISAGEVEASYATIQSLSSVKADIQTLSADNASIKNTLSANSAKITTLESDSATIKNSLSAHTAELEKLMAKDAEIEAIVAKKADIEYIESAAASFGELVAQKADISDLEAATARIGIIEADYVKASTLESDYLTAEEIEAAAASFGELVAQKADISDLEAATARIGDIETGYVKTSTLESDYIKSSEIASTYLTAANAALTYATIGTLDAATARISTIESGYVKTSTLTSDYLTSAQIAAKYVETSKLTTDYLTSAQIAAKYITTTSADAKYANIDFSNITKATMQKFYADSGLIKDATISEGTITGELIGVTISGDLIKANTLVANKLVIQGNDGLYYRLNTDGVKTETEQTDYNSLNGTVIKAKSITANKVNVTDLSAFGATIGGFTITANSLYSGVKSTVGNTTRGVYLDSTGQIAFGDAGNFIKYYLDTDGAYKLKVSAKEFILSSSGKSVETVLNKTVKEVHRYYCPVNDDAVVLQETTVSMEIGQEYMLAHALNIEAGETCTVYWNDVDYICTAWSTYIGEEEWEILGNYGRAAGGTDTGEPFCILSSEGNNITLIYPFDNIPEPKISILLKQTNKVLVPQTRPSCTNENFYYYDGRIGLQIGSRYTVNWNGTSYTCVAFEAEFEGTAGIGIGNFGLLSGGTNTGEPFILGEALDQDGVLIIALDGTSGDDNVELSIIKEPPAVEKPAAYPPPAPWTKTEPAKGCAAAVLCTVYTDGTFTYSDVSVGSGNDLAASALAAANAATHAISNTQAQLGEFEEEVYMFYVTDSELTQTANSIKSTVAATYQTKADMAGYSTTGQMNSAIEQKASSILSTVSSTYQTKSDMAGYSTTAQMNSAINQKADQISATVEASYNKTASRGEQLVTNGNALLGNNTNFSTWVYDGANANNSPGSFTKAAGSAGTYTTDEYFPVNPANEYTFSLDTKSAKGVGRLYSMLMFYDVDKNQISAGNHIHLAASTTTLAQDLKAGDTTIYLTSAAGWSTSFAHGFYMIVWNYKNSFGYTYPSCTYSRTRITLPKNGNYLNSANLNKTANTITLATAYSGATIPAGTSVSQGGDGATYKYFPCSNTLVPVTWASYSGKISGVDYSGQNKAAIFPPGTAYARIGFLWNYQGSGNGEQIWITNISVTDTTAASAAKTAADAAQTDVDALKTRVTQTESSITSQATQITNLGTRTSTVEQTAAGLTASLQTTNSNVTTAQNTANTANTNAANAAKTATNYLSFSSAGLVVGDMTASTLGKNVLIDSDSVDIRNGTTVLASFGADKIELGKNSTSSIIDLCGGKGQFAYGTVDGLGSTGLSLTADRVVIKGTTAAHLYFRNATTGESSSVIVADDGIILESGTTMIAVADWQIGLIGNAGVSGNLNVGGTLKVDGTEVSLNGHTHTQYSLTTHSHSYLPLSGGTLGGSLTFNVSSQSQGYGVKWSTSNSKNPYIGYATDQTDGTFVVASILGTNYASGLAIGGGSGNLLYKGVKVPTLSDTATTSTAGVMSAADKTKLNNTNVAYGTCTTAAATAEKVVTVSGNTNWALTAGSIIAVKFTNTNTASNPTLNVNGTGAKNIFYGTAQITTSSLSYAGYASRVLKFLYDGTQYWFVGWSYDANTNTQLRVYRQVGSSYNGDYPLIASRTKAASLGTVGTESSYGSVYGLISDTNANIPTINPYTGELKAKSLKLEGKLTVKANAEITGVMQSAMIEIYNSIPFIDFHFNNSTADYTSRIAEYSSGALTVEGTLTQTSDRRVKENIMPLGVEQLMYTDDETVAVDLHSELFDRLKPVQFNFIKGNKKICYGLIAQDVVDAMREVGIDENSLDLVHHNKWTEKTGEDKEQYSVSYNNVIALLIHEVQKLKEEIKNLKS